MGESRGTPLGASHRRMIVSYSQGKELLNTLRKVPEHPAFESIEGAHGAVACALVVIHFFLCGVICLHHYLEPLRDKGTSIE